jgi:ribosomal protein L11 methylase PrmA
MPPAVEDFEFVRSTGLVERMARDGRVIAAQEVAPDVLGEEAAGACYLLEHPRLPFISYPYEWSFPALKAAALLQLDIYLEALESGVTLSDASAYNIQFMGARAIFIDVLSFRRYREGEFWIAHRQFCEQFLNPLLLRAMAGVSHNAWYRGSPQGIPTADLARLLPLWRKLRPQVLTHVVLQASLQQAAMKEGGAVQASAFKQESLPLATFRRMLRKLRRWIAGLEPGGSRDTVWRNYTLERSYTSDERQRKAGFVKAFNVATRPALLWDLGCNTGDYAVAALENGAGYVVGFDSDHGALEAAFDRAASGDLLFLPLFFDVANPSPDQGWAERERAGLQARAEADGVLALALVHHLAIGHNLPLPEVVAWIVELAPVGVIEFVPKADPMVQRMLALREDIFPDYTEDSFLAAVAARARVVQAETISATGRKLVWFDRR